MNDYYKSLVNAVTNAANYNIHFVDSNTFRIQIIHDILSEECRTYYVHDNLNSLSWKKPFIMHISYGFCVVNSILELLTILGERVNYKYELAQLRQVIRQEELQTDVAISQLGL